ncbi:MAG: carboxypeptidase-like regulatory domain-containing protein [Bryobacteraceae bacterium]
MNLLRSKLVVAEAILLGVSLPGLAAESISGQVVHALTGNPLRRVTLTAKRIDGKGEPATTQVDDYGRFVFQNLAAGGYLLSGERNGFDRQIHGSRSNPNTGTVLAVKDGQPVTGVVFRLFPNAVLSGRVLDSDGEPMPNVGVRVLRREYRDGKRDWYPASFGSTNDRGEYRLSGLRPGNYLVIAADYNFGLAMLTATKGAQPEAPDRINGTTYYPGTLEAERAEPVTVVRGEDRRGIDIQLLKTTAVRIRGRIDGGDSGGMMVVSLMPRSAAPVSALAAGGGAMVQPGERTFEVKGVRPGAYWLFAQSMGGTPAMTTPLPIEVSDQHIDGVRLPFSEGVEVAGRVVSEGSVDGTSVHLASVEFSLRRFYSATADQSGEFKVKGVLPVPLRLRVANLPSGSYLKSVKLNGQVANPDNLTLSPGAKLEILLGKASAELKGVVLGADEKPSAGATVALVPESGRDALYRAATSGHDGTFLIQNVAPGRYKALAWEDLEPEAYGDPEVVKLVEDRAAQVVLKENGRSEVKLNVIPITKE